MIVARGMLRDWPQKQDPRCTMCNAGRQFRRKAPERLPLRMAQQAVNGVATAKLVHIPCDVLGCAQRYQLGSFVNALRIF